MKSILRNTGGYTVKSVLRSLLRPAGKLQKTRAEIMLDWLTYDKQTDGDVLCSVYYFFLEHLLSKMSKENDVEKELVKKVIRDYPIFRKMINKGLFLFLKGIEEHGLTMPQRLSAPFLVEFEITKQCNLLCKHCYASAGKKLDHELSTDETKRLIDQISQAGVPVICFTGGEPLLRDDFFELLNYSKDKGLITILTTNGSLITKDKAKKLKDIGIDYVRISLDGANARTHDWFRGVNGAFEKTTEGIRNCVSAGIKTGMGSVLVGENYKETGKLIDLAAELGCCDAYAIPVIPSGRGKMNLNREFRALSPEEKKWTEKVLLEKEKEHSGRLLVNFLDLDRVRKHPGIIQKLLGWAQGGCAAGRTLYVIAPNGDVRPCITMWLAVGNLRKQSFTEIWKGSKVFEELRDRSLLKGKCSKCDFKYSCGGCRATAYEVHGDYLQSDPSCSQFFF
jgi:radical SAM protein with 4Fe4S-binding SPASM domain